MKKVVLIPGIRFHVERYFDYYRNIHSGIQIYVITSSPYYKFNNKNFRYLYSPQLFLILQRLFKIQGNSYFKKFDSYLFQFFASIYIFFIKPDILHVWGSFAHRIFNKNDNYLKIIERSSTFLTKQLDIIKQENKKLGLSIKKIPDSFISNNIKELKMTDIIITPSEYAKNSFPAVFQDKITVIYPFSKNCFDYSYKTRDKNKFILGYVGANIVVKGLYYLLDIFISSKIFFNSHLWLKINRESLKDHEGLLAIIDNNPNIIIIGLDDDMEKFYQSLDCIVQPSIDDGFNMVTIEALSVGVPSFVSDKMGSSEFLKELIPENIFNLSNDEALASLINNLNKKDLLNQSIVIRKKYKYLFNKFTMQNNLNFNQLIKNA